MTESAQARQLRSGRVHERGDRLERHAAANAVLAGLFRRTFMRGAQGATSANNLLRDGLVDA